MKKSIFLLLMFVCELATASTGDTIKIKSPKFVSFQLAEGMIFPTSRITGKTQTPNVVSLNVKYGLLAKGDKWEDFYYGMPYRGIGIYKPFYSVHKETGQPFSVYLFQGGGLKTFRSGISLNYEINLGMSFNWKHFDIDERSHFEALGSSINAHLGGMLYLKKPISKRLDLHLGIDVLHFSNGALRTPNYGINSMSAVVGVAYRLHEERPEMKTESPATMPAAFKKRTVHDLSVFVTSRTVNIDTAETKLQSRYPERRFKVVGLNYAYMWHHARRFMWGPSVELLYDEGNKVKIDGEFSEETNICREVVKLGKVSDRFSVGLSLKGELAMPGYAVFANLGYNLLHHNHEEKRLYQIYGVKVYLTEGLSSSFGVRSNHLTHSQFLYLSVGYTFRTYRGG